MRSTFLPSPPVDRSPLQAEPQVLPTPGRLRRHTLGLLTATALTASLAACGGGSGSTDAAKPQSTAIDATTAAAAGAQPASAAASGADGAELQASAASAAADSSTAAAPEAAAQDAVASARIAAARVATSTSTVKTTTGTTTSPGTTSPSSTTAAATIVTSPTNSTALATATPAATTAATNSTTTAKAATTTAAVSNVPCSYEAKTSFAGSCSAFMSAVIADGESVTFSNTKAGYSGSVTASCSAGKISWVNATCQATTQGQMQFAATTASTAAAPPDTSKLKVFTAKPPFTVATKAGTKRVILGIYGSNDDVARTHDFVAPLVNPTTARTNVMTLQTTAVVNKVPTFTNVSDISTPPAAKADVNGRYGLDAQGQLRVAYLPNDPPSSEKLRTQVNSWPIPTRQTLTWDLSVRFAGSGAGETWPLTKFTASPVLIWQLKSDPGFPPMGMLVDVDPENPTKALQLTFFQRLSNVSAYSRRWVVGGIDPNVFNDLIVQAVPDDREPSEGGIGTLKVWLNGKLFVNTSGRNLIPDLPDVNRWCFGLYLTAESAPSPIGRYTTWRRARMLSN